MKGDRGVVALDLTPKGNKEERIWYSYDTVRPSNRVYHRKVIIGIGRSDSWTPQSDSWILERESMIVMLHGTHPLGS